MSTIKENDLNLLLRFGLTAEKIASYDILFLPENITTAKESDQLIDAPDSISLFKLLKIQGISCATSFDLALDTNMLERRSSENWYGTIFIRNKIVIPLFVSILSGLIIKVIDGKGEENQVHIDLQLERPESITSIKYDGDGETLLKILEAVKADPDNTQAK